MQQLQRHRSATITSTGTHTHTRTRDFIATSQQSKSALKNLFRVSISTICYLRDLFPQRAFKVWKLLGMDIHLLRTREEMSKKGRKSNNRLLSEAADVIAWIDEGLRDAIDRNYLEEVEFSVFQIDPHTQDRTVLEKYSFRIAMANAMANAVEADGDERVATSIDNSSTHSQSDSQSQSANSNSNSRARNSQLRLKLRTKPSAAKPRHLRSDSDVKRETMCLMRYLMLLKQTLRRLPTDNRFIGMRLFYFEHTPDDYRPPLFRQPGSGDVDAAFAAGAQQQFLLGIFI